ncbi:MAG: AzlD domain-containing protein [Pseudomonadota bacterium]
MTLSVVETWVVILAIGIGTFALRFSFLGGMGDRAFPAWALRLLRYTPVAVLPGLVAPLVFLPTAGASAPDPARIIAALVILIAGYTMKSAIWGMAAGAITFYGLAAFVS